jgi:hypothetical protein
MFVHIHSICKIDLTFCIVLLKVVTNEKGEAVGEVVTIIC